VLIIIVLIVVIDSRTKLVLSVMKTALAVDDFLRYLLKATICVRCCVHVRVNLWLEITTVHYSSKFGRIPATAFSSELITD